jgi:hypothetical protein
MISGYDLRLVESGGSWALAGSTATRFGLVDDYLGYLVVRLSFG